MAIEYKQKCLKCKAKYVLSTRRNRVVICYECLKQDMKGEIIDPVMRKLFDIPEEYYQNNSFLCDIKIKYLKYNNLSEKQLDAFKKVVAELDAAKSEQ